MAIKINPNTEYVKEIRKKLENNGNYCPCRLKKTKETKCMCKEFKEQVLRKEEGYCHCGLYYYEDAGKEREIE